MDWIQQARFTLVFRSNAAAFCNMRSLITNAMRLQGSIDRQEGSNCSTRGRARTTGKERAFTMRRYWKSSNSDRHTSLLSRQLYVSLWPIPTQKSVAKPWALIDKGSTQPHRAVSDTMCGVKNLLVSLYSPPANLPWPTVKRRL